MYTGGMKREILTSFTEMEVRVVIDADHDPRDMRWSRMFNLIPYTKSRCNTFSYRCYDRRIGSAIDAIHWYDGGAGGQIFHAGNTNYVLVRATYKRTLTSSKCIYQR
jgi:hypothetical protein